METEAQHYKRTGESKLRSTRQLSLARSRNLLSNRNSHVALLIQLQLYYVRYSQTVQMPHSFYVVQQLTFTLQLTYFYHVSMVRSAAYQRCKKHSAM